MQIRTAFKAIAAALLAVAPLPAQATIVAEYTFDGNANDSSGNNLNGTVVGATFAAGHDGQALSLDGNDYVSVAFPNISLSQFTVEAWINVPTYGSNLHYVSLQQGANYIVLGDYGSGIISTWADGLNPIQLNGGNAASATDIWRHIAFTYDGSTQRIFVDGLLVGSAATTGSLSGAYNAGLVIGARHTQNTQFVTGLIDDVRIHDVALSANQLAATSNSVPEPSTWAMMLFGFGAVGFTMRKRKATGPLPQIA